MSFGNDLSFEFKDKTSKYRGLINEVVLFRILAEAVRSTALKNKKESAVFEIHKSLVNFEEQPSIDFYYKKDHKKCVSCELADIMFIIYNNKEARLCLMQNKFDRRTCRNKNFKADTRQLYILKNRPEYWKGRKHDPKDPSEQIISSARYNSITNYGVFAKDETTQFDMEYYNADSLLDPTGKGKVHVVNFDIKYNKYDTIDHMNDQLNYAFNLVDFGNGLINMQIGEKFNDIERLLKTINIKEVFDYFSDKIFSNNIFSDNIQDIEYNPHKSSILARCIVIVKSTQDIYLKMQ